MSLTIDKRLTITLRPAKPIKETEGGNQVKEPKGTETSSSTP